ncbi:CarD family transcriptional regulator [Terrisporobacter petrolearius]|uniref:CarD family transcriptional regulator n=1 Tax=Terrisporobacter petrolearius TaxID=1460447 RepID=UPI001D1629FE|nr:CarD family transcriptional regulator [Terrisporobacter petrolearius]MCC3864038.1 CarD family transcriptional regulator [Terrisporobacter petrolearius]
MYKIGEFIVYGNEGVCRVDDISELSIGGSSKGKTYYTLKPMHDNGTVFAPIDTTVFMRPIVSYEEVHKLIEQIPSIKEIDHDDKSVRELQEYYKKLIKNHDCMDLLTIMITLRDKKKVASNNGKKLSQMDDKFMRTAQNLIENEFSIVLGIEKDDVELYIDDSLNKM